MPDWIPIAEASECPPGTSIERVAAGRMVAVANVDGTLHALDGLCPHQGGDLCEGLVTAVITADRPGEYRMSRHGEIIRCPWHGWEFDIRTGQSWCEPDRIHTKQYPVEIAAGTDLVKGPYIAETIPVAVEKDYIVVEV